MSNELDVEFEPEGAHETAYMPVREFTKPKMVSFVLHVNDGLFAKAKFKIVATVLLLGAIVGLSILVIVAGYKTVQVSAEIGESIINVPVPAHTK